MICSSTNKDPISRGSNNVLSASSVCRPAFSGSKSGSDGSLPPKLLGVQCVKGFVTCYDQLDTENSFCGLVGSPCSILNGIPSDRDEGFESFGGTLETEQNERLLPKPEYAPCDEDVTADWSDLSDVAAEPRDDDFCTSADRTGAQIAFRVEIAKGISGKAIQETLCTEFGACLSTDKVPLCSALKGTRNKPKGIRVTWAPDVYDPPPSIASHTVKPNSPAGKGQKRHSQTFSRRRGDHGKGKKKGGGSNGSSKKSGKKAPAHKKVPAVLLPAQVVTKAPDEDEALKAPSTCDVPLIVGQSEAQVNNSQAEAVVEDTDDGWNVVAHKPRGGRKSSTAGPRREALCAAGGTGRKAVLRNEAGLQESDASKLGVKPLCSTPTKKKDLRHQLSCDRLAGVSALASGDMEAGRKLLLGVLAISQQDAILEEEARCLRLLADLEVGDDRLRNLIQAVEAFSNLDLPFEKAEALLSVAQHKLAAHSGSPSVTRQPDSHPANKSTVETTLDGLERIKLDLGHANRILQGAIDGYQADCAAGDEAKKIMAKEELATAKCMMGTIHEVLGRTYLLSKDYRSAREHFCLALEIDQWAASSKEDAMHVRSLLSMM